jgi:exopolysaccharide biosynthesis polyprenyl glycosylphosphotransferase
MDHNHKHLRKNLPKLAIEGNRVIKRRFDFKIFWIDFLTINFAWLLYYFFRMNSGFAILAEKPDLWGPLSFMWLYWSMMFLFFGLYRVEHAASRADEFTSVMKAASVGCLVLFFVIFIDDTNAEAKNGSRMLMFAYWGIMVVMTGSGRVIYRTVRRRLLAAGVGLHNALIVGWNDKARELHDLVGKYPALGYRVIGFVKLDKRKRGNDYRGTKLLGTTDDLNTLIKTHNIRDLLIALESHDHNRLLDIIALCNGHDVSMKIMPDMYDIISGQARTNQIYGFPLIEIMPQIMQPWEQSMKRMMDVVVSLIMLTLSIPLWILIAIAIKIDSPGTIVFSQDRVGKDGKIFRMHKFRSMYNDAEAKTGPVWAPKNDHRVTKVGRFLRRARLDEIPQFINVLDGDMSLVGPRPERPFFVDKLSKEIPLYKRRLKVRPGITGWAQIKQGYDQSVDDVRSKVRYDLFYIENMSLRMDFKIIFNTLYVMLMGKGN